MFTYLFLMRNTIHNFLNKTQKTLGDFRESYMFLDSYLTVFWQSFEHFWAVIWQFFDSLLNIFGHNLDNHQLNHVNHHSFGQFLGHYFEHHFGCYKSITIEQSFCYVNGMLIIKSLSNNLSNKSKTLCVSREMISQKLFILAF